MFVLLAPSGLVFASEVDTQGHTHTQEAGSTSGPSIWQPKLDRWGRPSPAGVVWSWVLSLPGPAPRGASDGVRALPGASLKPAPVFFLQRCRIQVLSDRCGAEMTEVGECRGLMASQSCAQGVTWALRRLMAPTMSPGISP